MIKKLKTAVVMVVVLIAASIGGVYGKKIANWINGDPLEAAMQDAVNAIRPTVPRKIDELTTLVSVDLLKTTMMYHYRMNLDASKINKKDFELKMQSKLIKNVCGSPMINTINIGAIYGYIYTDTQGDLITTIKVSKKECANA